MERPVYGTQIELFSTCPPADSGSADEYLRKVEDVAQWSERAGYAGILVYSDNSQYEPWMIADLIIRKTKSLCPLVAVQPVYMHPYTVAKRVASIAQLYGRRVYLNMVAGGFKNDLVALNDETPHDKRYIRLIEYTEIILQLLHGKGPVSYAGEFYRAENLKLAPRCPADLLPGVFGSGSSDAGLAAARRLGATAIKYPKPSSEYRGNGDDREENSGIRIGIISRERSDTAWAEAHARFPEDRKGQLTHQLAMKTSDSVWHRQLSELAATPESNPYWLVPFENYKTMCPYLVGSYDEVGRELAGYMSLGYRTFITDIPAAADELAHTAEAFTRAQKTGWQLSFRTG
jgi:alkanesulfonate monooxygenase